MKRLLAVMVAMFIVVPMYAQKGAADELGFNPEKLYDFTSVDAVNSFNGNLTLAVPLGPEYHVGPTLSYRFTLYYNGKMWDYETHDCYDNVTCDPGERRTDSIPNRRSNAGVGWRLSFGRLLAPTDTTIDRSSDQRNLWIYEGAAGDEHAFSAANPGIAVDTSALRLVTINASTRQVEFPNGDRHEFALERNDWRIRKIADRFGNAVNFTYHYDSNDREDVRTITDTIGRSHSVSFMNYSAMGESVDRGQNVASIALEGVGGAIATYALSYELLSVRVGRYGVVDHVTLPMLSRILEPGTETDPGPDFQFSYYQEPLDADGSQGALKRMKLPTGGVVEYQYQYYVFSSRRTCSNVAFGNGGIDDRVGVRKRTVYDGVASSTWDYIQRRGPSVVIDYPDPEGDYCCTGARPATPPVGPFYWSRTTVLSPVMNGVRTRTDNYFDIFSVVFDYQNECPSSVPQGAPEIVDELPYGRGAFGYPGVIAAPPPSRAKQSPYQIPEEISTYPTDLQATDAAGRRLTRQIYTDCASDGDCTNGVLRRSVYSAYETHPLAQPACPYPYACDTWEAALQWQSSSTVANDDNGCSGPCTTTVDSTGDNGAGLYKTVTESSNYPNAKKRVSSTDYTSWSAADVNNTAKPWILGLYGERSVTEGASTVVARACFDANTGFLLRERFLAGGTPGTSDVITVHTASSHGDVASSATYGGDAQSVGTGSLCALALPSSPVYEVKNEYQSGQQYTGGILAQSRFVDRATHVPMTFYSMDRSIDRFSGFTTSARDVAGVETAFTYNPLRSTLVSTTSAAGATSTYEYTNASGAADGTFSPAKVTATTSGGEETLMNEYLFDGLGRLVIRSERAPSFWTAARTTFDADGHVLQQSAQESTGNDPAMWTWTPTAATNTGYDGLGRPVSVTTPDTAVTRFSYTGNRVRSRTSGTWTGVDGDPQTAGTQDLPVTVIEENDSLGRLVTVTENSGPTSSTAVTGVAVNTRYTYDAAGRLTSVRMGDGTAMQNRIFDYDGRGFLRWESQPESGMVSYQYDALGHVLSKTQSAANSLFDLKYSYDGAGRPIRVDARNPFYGTAGQTQFRPMKEFEYGSDNDGTDLRLGKLVSATRHNYGLSVGDPDYSVKHEYTYDDDAGRLTGRTTTIYEDGNYVQSVTMSAEYDELNELTSLSYPMCIACGVPDRGPDRSDMTYGYERGRLTSLTDFVTSVSYWPNGMRNVLAHSNGIADTQVVANMARPSSISFGTYDRCVRPAFVSQPVSTQVSAPGGTATLAVSVNGTGPFQFSWMNLDDGSSAGSTQSITVHPNETTEYYVTVSNACGYEDSQTARVDVGTCTPPSTGAIKAVAQPDGTWILRPNPEARSPRTFSWKRLSDNTIVGNSETLTVGVLSQTTTYRLTITDACGSGSADVTISVPLPITAGLLATAVTTTQVTLNWPAITGATQYSVQRRSAGGDWVTIGATAARTYTDNGVTSAVTYVYRILSNNGGMTNSDVATTTFFAKATAGFKISTFAAASILSAVNSVRAAAGWPAVTWTNILATSDPLPVSGGAITARQVMAGRARMNEALQAIGVTVAPYGNPDLLGVTVTAAGINEVLARAE